MSQTTTGANQTEGSVVFDYTWFQTRYPELARWCSPGLAQGYFDLATLYLDNTAGAGPTPFLTGYGYAGSRWTGSIVRSTQQRQILLGLLTAHIAQMNAPLGGAEPSGLVGRISSASEGSVSVSVDYPQVAGAEWFMQTKYGAMFWQATAAYRQARYYPGPQKFSQDLPFQNLFRRY